ncbi:ATP-binding cassette domain-containing protein [Candidatus Thioglobus sp.]|jgi:ATP-binding cassette subfamily F protein uup|uniref:ATP-binding cassette domain-containing protein n=1 Tax=Candidatus Thioglobus sp. TaxID=2026721 RepID=UPI001D5AEF90|nr:ATP-binding cassette domain-containing protein [Candidatus Thioglobus sp.]MBT3277623.1 ATP-binding cassette domain-containing protein [Candidatus Thioglobus sp.]MBT3446999.1 ATP-binding cassette domain-containing protein [Candidatus Thioglobus sp.]MBT3744999.1 ATP-binding cassette domain-containing protein [Candidatus Thioglobus sp.]MBT4000522.1 ATP-binding cassette domain-containing protein [Candidatus Thioglobus sp.]MBT4181471.1 ATP-binding cassette domain-containing protein [Candidatus T
MPLITLDSISLSFSDKPILNKVSSTILKGDKIALIGRNGEGKSTFMRILAGTIEPDDGKLKIKNGIKISYLEQMPPEDNDKNLFDIVSEGLGEIGNIIAQYQHLINNGELNKAGEFQEKIDQLDGWQYLHKIEAILNRFTLNPQTSLSTLSGGWRRRVMLARALIQEPDVLLLDEPTNHMDITAILDLERMLKEYHGTLVIISHDRSFIAGIVNKVFDLDRGHLSVFECGYKAYVKRKDEQLHAEEIANARFDKKLAQEEVWIRQGIKARRTRNEGRVRALESMRKSFTDRRAKKGNVKIHALEDENRASKVVFEVKKISYDIAGLELVKDFSTLILKGEKIGIIGGNGSGKSTFIKLLLDELQPTKGSIRRSKTIQLAYFDQMRDNLDPNMKAMDFVSGGRERIEIGGKSKHIIGYLRQFLFTGKQAMAPIRMFSGGEKNRLMLAKILSQPANLLVLDEPTNDLDVETLELLEEMLVDYNGTLILISHDRTFLNNVVGSTVVLDGDGVINQYAGGYDDYLIQKQDKIAVQKTKTKVKPKAEKPSNNSPKKLTYKQQQELKKLPEKIEKTEIQIGEIQMLLSDPEFFQTDESQDALIRLARLEADLERYFDKWGELE